VDRDDSNTVMAAVDDEEHHGQEKSGQREMLFSIWRNTETKKFVLNSKVDDKVWTHVSIDKGKPTNRCLVTGVLKGYDQLMNLVLDEVKETLRDPEDENVLLDQTRDLGMVVVRGPLLLSLSPVAGNEVISNPFVQPE
jgi:small nuclear ribonucleoprotein (snRNP)-like protein